MELALAEMEKSPKRAGFESYMGEFGFGHVNIEILSSQTDFFESETG